LISAEVRKHRRRKSSWKVKNLPKKYADGGMTSARVSATTRSNGAMPSLTLYGSRSSRSKRRGTADRETPCWESRAFVTTSSMRPSSPVKYQALDKKSGQVKRSTPPTLGLNQRGLKRSLRPCLRPAAGTAKRTLATSTRAKKFITPKNRAARIRIQVEDRGVFPWTSRTGRST